MWCITHVCLQVSAGSQIERCQTLQEAMGLYSACSFTQFILIIVYIYIYIINGLTPWCRRPPIKGGQGRGRRRFTHTHRERERDIYIYLDLPVPSKMWDFWNLQVLKGKTRCLVLRLSRPAQNVPHTSFKAEEKQLVRPREVPWPSKRHAFESCCGRL